MDDRDRIREALDASATISRQDLADALRCSLFSVGRLLRKDRKLAAHERDAAFQLLGLATRGRMVPVIGEAPAGNWREAILEPIDWEFTTKGGPNTFALDVEGDSLDNVIKPGLRAIIDPDDRDLVSGKIYLVSQRDVGVTLKRFRGEPARLEPDSRNKDHRPILIGSDDFHLVGRVAYVAGDPALL